MSRPGWAVARAVAVQGRVFRRAPVAPAVPVFADVRAVGWGALGERDRCPSPCLEHGRRSWTRPVVPKGSLYPVYFCILVPAKWFPRPSEGLHWPPSPGHADGAALAWWRRGLGRPLEQ